MTKIIAGILAGIFVLVGLASFRQVDTGNVGVVTTFGKVQPEVLTPGVYFMPISKVTEVMVKEVPLQLADLRPQTVDKITLADLDLDIYVQLADPSKVPELFTKWPADLTQVVKSGEYALGLNFVTRQAREAAYNAVAKRGSATVHTERATIAAGVVQDLQANLDAEAGKGLFIVKSANVRNLVTDPALEANIKAAAQAQFKLQEEENRKKVATVEADRKRIEAQGEADAIRIKAEAVAKQGGSEYVQLQAIAKWDGKLPATNAGGAVPFISLK